MPRDHIFSVSTSEAFEKQALATFRYQYKHAEVYRRFCNLLQVAPERVASVQEIPFLPIELFRKHAIRSEEKNAEAIFSSSGTTASIPSRHYVADLSLYRRSFLNGFARCYGDPKEWVILALLPSYLEREGSSLVYMVDRLITHGGHPDSGFYLNDTEGLARKLTQLEARGQQTLLIGVSFALLDFIEHYSFSLKHVVIMETGGMKGRREEFIREALHDRLKLGFGVSRIHSEYGMTELLSQAYSKGDGIFCCPPWMKVLTRDTENALEWTSGKTGGINVIDLANLYSCSFIATQDLGRMHPDGSFEILGRFDNSDIRGCNLMVE